MGALVIDSRPSEREGILRVLRRDGCVAEALDVDAALALVSYDPPSVVIVGAPAGDAAHLVGRVRQADRAQRAFVIAVVEGTDDRSTVGAVFAAGAHDFVRRSAMSVELTHRVLAPSRLRGWAMATARSESAADLVSFDPERLKVWQRLGAIAGCDVARVVGQPLVIARGWPKGLGAPTRGATVALALPKLKMKLRISVAADEATQRWLGEAILNDAEASGDALSDVLRELANTAAGAVKRASLEEGVAMTASVPADELPGEPGERTRWWTLHLAARCPALAVVGELRSLPCAVLPASRLREGMVVVHDLRSDRGALLLPGGTRLTETSAGRLASLLGQIAVEVADAS